MLFWVMEGNNLAHYTKTFFQELRNGVTQSAEAIVPLVLGLVPAHSVVDVGCGDGTWLAIFRKYGVADIVGIDGEYIEPALLQIPTNHFNAFDLTKPLDLGRTFDLAVSLEVAEHLPPECASTFVGSLTRLAPVILFSAAIPFQGGNRHVNEQWPDKWAELFQKHDYLPVDCIRKRVWQNEKVEWWYVQNMLVFVKASLVESSAVLKTEFEKTNRNQLCLVHPRKYLEVAVAGPPLSPQPPSGVREALRFLLVCLKNAVKKRLDAITGKETCSNVESDSRKPARQE
jgi:SAM-dependent methyltransferase